MKEIVVNIKNMLPIKLMHYFVTEQDYNMMVVPGSVDEIWLENFNSSYKIVRIVNRYIHNNEQLLIDTARFKSVTKRIKVKTFSLSMKVLNIYTNLGDNVDLDKTESNENMVFVKQDSDVENPIITKNFPDIFGKLKYNEEGIMLFMKMTKELEQSQNKRNQEAEEVFSHKKPIITYILMALCAGIYLWMLLSGRDFSKGIAYLDFGACLDIMVRNGQYWRLISCIFVHSGALHLIFNMYALYIIGPQIESFFGRKKFLFIYLFSGLCGSLLSIAFNHNTITMGASGAIFGLLGAMLYFGYHYRAYLGNVVKSQIIPIILINLVIGFTSAGIDNAGHIGGLIGGLVATIALGVKHRSTTTEKVNGWIILIILSSFLLYLGLVGIN